MKIKIPVINTAQDNKSLNLRVKYRVGVERSLVLVLEFLQTFCKSPHLRLCL